MNNIFKTLTLLLTITTISMSFNAHAYSLEIVNNSDGNVRVQADDPSGLWVANTPEPGSIGTIGLDNCPTKVTAKKLTGTGAGKEISIDTNCQNKTLTITNAPDGFKVDIH